ncbi:hypothetical protein HPB50_007494 [Hyalomma asiaticum]|uniref:Uncharacterized protein n=1 Tax=Hyalomma asiaticum TaxID=266040 RepID=A0ACB7S3E9_HYAAI|nr:hypothetical protein HPB50_007494 [Hyalomma asiaticum]
MEKEAKKKNEKAECDLEMNGRLTICAQLFEVFPFAIAAFDADQDGDLDCLTAIREDYDTQMHYAKYLWVFPGVNGHKK